MVGLRAWLALVIFCSLAVPASGWQDDERDELKTEILAAIEKGKEALLRRQKSGKWYYRENPDFAEMKDLGATALVSLALMECGVPPSDEAIQKAAKLIRTAAKAPDFNYTYSVNLFILFLHRVNQGATNSWIINHPDAPMIRDLTKRVIAGQDKYGGWGYYLTGGGADNSNTQFGVVGLWVARKYFEDTSKERAALREALRKTEDKFRRSQRPGGSWAYDSALLGVSLPPTPSMTCAALLGLATGQGQLHETEFRGANANSAQSGAVYNKLEIDPQIKLAKAYLEITIKEMERGQVAREHATYFLWSLERVCLLLRWKKIGELDWHAIGSKYLISKQLDSGLWNIDDHDGVNSNTAFAMLFLVKSNLLGPLEEAEFRPGAITAGGPEKKPILRKRPETAAEINTLFESLVTANPTERLNLLRDSEGLPGDAVTTRLAEAVAKMPTEPARQAVRDTLTRRLQGATVGKLNDLIRTTELREIKLAAVRAAGTKGEEKPLEADAKSRAERKSLIVHLIVHLEDADKELSDQALLSLVSMTGQNFGRNTNQWTLWLNAMP
jgi:hypothetical protein